MRSVSPHQSSLTVSAPVMLQKSLEFAANKPLPALFVFYRLSRERPGKGRWLCNTDAAAFAASAALGALLAYLYLVAPLHPAASPAEATPASFANLSEVQRQQLAEANAPQRQLLRAAFVILVGRRPEELIPTLKRLWVNFLWEFPYEVWLLLPDDVDLDHLQVVKEREDLAMVLPLVKYVGMAGTWDFSQQMVEFMQQPGFNASDMVWNYGFPGYHHMCRFWTMQIFKHPDIGQLDYYCRLDAHSWVNSPIKYDIFRFMQVNGLKYGFNSQSTDAGYVTLGLWNFTEDFVASHETNAAGNHIMWPPLQDREADGRMPMYYTNFEVVDVPAFRDSSQISDFNAAIDDTNAIYRYRWGDAPLRWWQVNLFMNTGKDVKQFRDFEYSHPGNIGKVVDFRRKCTCCECKFGDQLEPPDGTPEEDLEFSPESWVFDKAEGDYVYKRG